MKQYWIQVEKYRGFKLVIWKGIHSKIRMQGNYDLVSMFPMESIIKEW
jgi:hypothetical protein